MYPYVEESDSYENVVEVLRRTLVKTKNNVCARHLLVSRRQRPDESISEYLQVLKTLAKALLTLPRKNLESNLLEIRL